VSEIDEGIMLLSSLSDLKTSYQFIELFLSQDKDLLNFEEDYQDLETFYETQFSTWQSLNHSLNNEFARNRSFLDKSNDASDALKKLEAIYNNPKPYRELRNVKPLIEKVQHLNNKLITLRQTHATKVLKKRIEDVQQHLNDANAPSELSNSALRPLQLSLAKLDTLNSVADINQELSESEFYVEEAERLINDYIEQQLKLAQQAQKEAERKAAEASAAQNNSGGSSSEGNTSAEYGSGGTATISTPVINEPPAVQIVLPKVKKIVPFEPSDIYRTLSGSDYIETLADIDAYVAVLKKKLSELVATDHKVRIK